MRILQYECRDPMGWHFQRVDFGKINLLVGNSGSGKTRFLNTIFNLGRSAVQNTISRGRWQTQLEQEGTVYYWTLDTTAPGEPEGGVTEETLTYNDAQGHATDLVVRDANRFIFDGQALPKIARNISAIAVLKDNDRIKPLYQGFTALSRRDFNTDVVASTEFLTIPPNVWVDVQQALTRKSKLEKLFQAALGLNITLYMLSQIVPDVFNQIVNHFREVFQFVEEARFTEAEKLQPYRRLPGAIPIFSVREKGASMWVGLRELSSGMQKVLLMLTDTILMPDGSIYLIDEYENSLGINAIDFLPNYLYSSENTSQFIITSHHPYIINQIPVENWYVFHRHGLEVSIRFGDELKRRYSASKQQAFVQLINDPFFSEGIE